MKVSECSSRADVLLFKEARCNGGNFFICNSNLLSLYHFLILYLYSEDLMIRLCTNSRGSSHRMRSCYKRNSGTHYHHSIMMYLVSFTSYVILDISLDIFTTFPLTTTISQRTKQPKTSTVKSVIHIAVIQEELHLPY